MKLIDRYIIVEFVRNFLLALIILTFVFFVSDYLRGVWDAEVTAAALFRYSAMQIPQIMCQMVPAAAMLGTMTTLSLMNRRNELTAIHASGISLTHVSFLIFGAIFIACCLTLVTYDRVVPPLTRQRMVYYWKNIKGRKDFSLDIKATKIWYRSKNYIYNLRLFDKKRNAIEGIGIYLFDKDFRLMQHLEAETAQYEPGGAWVLRKGMMTVFPEESRFPLSKNFSEKRIRLPESPKDFLEIEKQVETLRIKELWGFIRRNKNAGIDTKFYEVDFHSRLAISFIPLVMGLLAVPFSVRPKQQGGLGRDLAVCVGLIFLYWLMFSVSLTMGRSGTIVPWLSVWGPSALFLAAGILLIVRSRAT
ncbi:MAG: LPS export ABC transporter permease LptG [Deltaproteobacteria bacterium]|nr:LPS export ABC transporter permease LptG [Deltaproteobacteria bacterium]